MGNLLLESELLKNGDDTVLLLFYYNHCSIYRSTTLEHMN